MCDLTLFRYGITIIGYYRAFITKCQKVISIEESFRLSHLVPLLCKKINNPTSEAFVIEKSVHRFLAGIWCISAKSIYDIFI